MWQRNRVGAVRIPSRSVWCRSAAHCLRCSATNFLYDCNYSREAFGKFGPSHIQTILSPQSRPCRQCPDLLTILTGPNHGPGLCRPVHLKLRTQAAYMKAMVYIVRSFGNTIHNYCPTPCVPCLNVVPSPLKVSSSILNEPQPWNRGKIFRFPWYTALSYAAADWLKFENWRYLRPGIGSAISRVQKGTR